MTKTRRKSNTAMVFNPSRGLSIGGRRSTVRRAAARKNPVRKAGALTKSNPRSRRRVARRNNPATFSGLLVASVMAGVGVSIFDVVTTRFLPQQSPLVRIGIKAGAAYLLQSKNGAMIPVLGKYKNEIALVLGVSAVVDAMKLWVMPVINQAVGNLTGGASRLVAAPAAQGDGGLGDIYGNSLYREPIYA